MGRLVIPRSSSFIPTLLQVYHDSPLGRHSREFKTYKRVATKWYWMGMNWDIQKYVASCQVCQKNKSQSLLPGGLLQPLPLPDKVWKEISMDFIECLLRSEGYVSIFVVVDRLSKYAHFMALHHPYIAKTVANVFISEIVHFMALRHTFMSSFWIELFKVQGTALNRSTAHHPQSDGQTEVVNCCLKAYLRCFSSDKPRQWKKWLPWAEFWYNTLFHTATRTTLFRILYGRDPHPLIRYSQKATMVSEVEQQLETRDTILEELKLHLSRAQEKMKTTTNKRRRDVQFEVGDKVFLKLCPYRQQSLAKRHNEKLAPRFYRPYEVLARVGAVAYNLSLPEGARIPLVLHVS